jgi:hypothetical protein
LGTLADIAIITGWACPGSRSTQNTATTTPAKPKTKVQFKVKPDYKSKPKPKFNSKSNYKIHSLMSKPKIDSGCIHIWDIRDEVVASLTSIHARRGGGIPANSSSIGEGLALLAH